jgi:pantetheine-phosphate adenylyltransferase
MSGTPARTALFPGTFDPFTNGHLDLAERAAKMFPRVVIAVAASPKKGTMFPLAERVELVQVAIAHLANVSVIGFDGLVVDCARRVGAEVMCRGIRAVSDFEFEFQMALMNRKLSPSLEVAFLMPSQQYTYLNSTLVKEVARLGGSVTGLVPATVEERLLDRLGLPRPKPAAEGKAPRGKRRAARAAGKADAGDDAGDDAGGKAAPAARSTAKAAAAGRSRARVAKRAAKAARRRTRA